MAKVVSIVVLSAIAIVIGVLFFQVMASFLLPMFLAVLLVVMFKPLHAWFVTRCKKRTRLAAGLTTASILLIVLLPLLLILLQAAGEVVSLVGEWKEPVIRARLDQLRRVLGLNLPDERVLTGLARIEERLHAWRLHPATDESHSASVDKLSRRADQIRAVLDAEARTARGKEQAVPRWRESLTALDDSLAALRGVRPSGEAFVPALDEAEHSLDHLKTALLGGPLIYWLRQQANPSAQQIGELAGRAKALAGPLALKAPQVVGGFLSELLLGMGVMIVSLYYFLADGPALIQGILRLSPLDDRHEQQLLTEFSTVSRAVVVATLLSAFVQGLLAMFGYFLAGFESVFLLTMLTMLFALVPFVGAAAVWGSCCLWLLVDGRLTAAVVLLLYGVLIISMADNVIKPWVLKGQSNLHPLFALLSVLGGVQAMGPIGILVGPMIVAFLQALLTMLRSELASLEGIKKKPALAPSPGTV